MIKIIKPKNDVVLVEEVVETIPGEIIVQPKTNWIVREVGDKVPPGRAKVGETVLFHSMDAISIPGYKNHRLVRCGAILASIEESE